MIPASPDVSSAPASGLPLPPARRRVREWVLIATLVLLTLAYYFWTVVCPFDGIPRLQPRGYPETDHFNMLSHGFLKGHLHLDCEVPEALRLSPFPYDPTRRGNVEVLHDASYYNGKYYIYFGPGPVVALLLPFHVLTGRDLPLFYGVFLFTSLGYLVLVATFLFLQRRHFPRASGWTIAASLIALGGASMLVALLRRPHIWEFPAAAGFAFFMISLHCLVRALHSPHAVRWTLAGGLALGMAVASRPTYLLCSVLFALPWLRLPRERYGWRALLAAAGGCTAIVLAILAYNYARFGEPFEFGQKYQLSAIVEGEARHFSLSYVAFNAQVYFFKALRWLETFPFHHGIVLPPFPPGHGGYEYAIGLLPNLPFALLGFVGIASAFWLRRAWAGDDLRRLTVLLIFLAGALQSAVLLCYFGVCIRYMADFTPAFMLLAGLGLLAAEDFLPGRLTGVALRGAATALALFSSFAAAASVVGLYETPRDPIPASYAPVRRALNYPTYALRQRQGDHRPVEISLTPPTDQTPREEPLVAVAREGRTTATVSVHYLGKNQLRLGYREANDRPPQYSAPVLLNWNDRQRLQLSVGGNYADYDGSFFRLRADLNGWTLWDVPIVSFDTVPGTLQVNPTAGGAGFSGTIHEERRIHPSDFAARRLGGARLRITLQPEMAGRSFPLLTSGRFRAGDLLFFRVSPTGSMTLCYDHWADDLRVGPELPTTFGREYTFEVWTPPITASRSDLLVKLDGNEVWRESAPGFAVKPESVFVGLNPIGGSTCELVLIHSSIEETQLNLPPR